MLKWKAKMTFPCRNQKSTESFKIDIFWETEKVRNESDFWWRRYGDQARQAADGCEEI